MCVYVCVWVCRVEGGEHKYINDYCYSCLLYACACAWREGEKGVIAAPPPSPHTPRAYPYCITERTMTTSATSRPSPSTSLLLGSSMRRPPGSSRTPVATWQYPMRRGTLGRCLLWCVMLCDTSDVLKEWQVSDVVLYLATVWCGQRDV